MMTTAYTKSEALAGRLQRAGIDATTAQAETLRRAALTLSRWAERECGDGSNWAIERVAKVCEALGAHYFHQTDQNYSRGVSCWID